MYRKLLAILLLISYTSSSTALSLKGRKHRYSLHKRFHSNSASGNRNSEGPRLFYKGRLLSPVTHVTSYDSVTLDCEVGGTPTPTIHWLKNGERLTQGVYHGFKDDAAVFEDRLSPEGKPLLRLSSTKSKLFIPCLTRETGGEYSCIAETPYSRIEKTTKVVIDADDYNSIETCLVKKSLEGEAARIYLWTKSRLEYEDATVQLFCRAEGNPTPKISWFDNTGKLITEDSDEYNVADNGDLIIKNVNWRQHMGDWMCQAENEYGIDRKETFLYPTPREDDEDIPL